MQKLSPVTSTEREIFMDVLRGFAILGIFIANLGSGFSGFREEAGLTGPYLLGDWDHKMAFLHRMFIEGKFYSIFSLLFGWGLAMQFIRGEQRGINTVPTVRRRLMFMLLLGAIHLMIWPGDIVFFYALLAFVFLPFRKMSDKKMLATGLILVLSPILLYAAKAQWPWLNAPSGFLFQTGQEIDKKILGISSEAEYHAFVKTAGWWDLLKGNVAGFFYRYGYLFFVSRIPKVLGLFFIGYGLGRSGFYQNITKHKNTLYWILGAGLLIGLPANFYLARYITYYMNDYWNLKRNGFYQTLAYALGVAPLAMAYVSLLMLSFQSGLGNRILLLLAPVGKMAFTNYIMQSLIGHFVFLNAGLGFYGKVGPVYFTLFGIMIFILQIILSTIWLRYFHYGPVEWLWRSATYKKWQRMKKHVAVTASE